MRLLNQCFWKTGALPTQYMDYTAGLGVGIRNGIKFNSMEGKKIGYLEANNKNFGYRTGEEMQGID